VFCCQHGLAAEAAAAAGAEARRCAFHMMLFKIGMLCA
jgi:hypothetical protein